MTETDKETITNAIDDLNNMLAKHDILLNWLRLH